jgi:hypothetical protein
LFLPLYFFLHLFVLHFLLLLPTFSLPTLSLQFSNQNSDVARNAYRFT